MRNRSAFSVAINSFIMSYLDVIFFFCLPAVFFMFSTQQLFISSFHIEQYRDNTKKKVINFSDKHMENSCSPGNMLAEALLIIGKISSCAFLQCFKKHPEVTLE